ncbi:MAG: HlyD family efflux transporter periplasmic adaptor subunit [Pirellulaceae bacterium]|nr:HlyD family efflux transporter periplasmic adaptor subunit [Pirellulaceae bacterium]MDP7019141.1 HlyD family efflux transporter periplasmic adaptor subunit [Pirellulaceae bacterium]
MRLLTKIIAPAAIVGFGLLAYFWLQSQRTPPARVTEPPAPTVVQTIEFDPQPSDVEIRVWGTVTPHRVVTIKAQVAGRIVQKRDRLQAGRFVKAGELLLQIDPEPYELSSQAAAAEAARIGEDLKQLAIEESGNAALVEIATDELRLANKELTRDKGLFASKSTSEANLDQSERSALKARTALQLLETNRRLIPVRRQRLQVQLKSAALRQKEAELRLGWTDMTAPFDGVIATDTVEIHDFVQPGDRLLEVDEAAAVEVACDLTSDELYWLWDAARLDGKSPEHPLEIPPVDATVTYIVGGRSFEWPGRLSRYEGKGIDSTTRTAPCRVVVASQLGERGDGPPALIRGMHVEVTIRVQPQTRLWLVPAQALRPNGQVWTIANGRLRGREIQPVRVSANGTLIRADESNLQPGDQLVTSQLASAFDGMPIRAAEAEGEQP